MHSCRIVSGIAIISRSFRIWPPKENDWNTWVCLFSCLLAGTILPCMTMMFSSFDFLLLLPLFLQKCCPNKGLYRSCSGFKLTSLGKLNSVLCLYFFCLQFICLFMSKITNILILFCGIRALIGVSSFHLKALSYCWIQWILFILLFFLCYSSSPFLAQSSSASQSFELDLRQNFYS